VKTDISAVLMVKSGLDPHMIIELKDDLIDVLYLLLLSYLFIYLRVGIHLRLFNACQIKLDQLKILIAVKPCQLFLDYSLACYVIYSTC
jgi:hypothetical protein